MRLIFHFACALLLHSSQCFLFRAWHVSHPNREGALLRYFNALTIQWLWRSWRVLSDVFLHLWVCELTIFCTTTCRTCLQIQVGLFNKLSYRNQIHFIESNVFTRLNARFPCHISFQFSIDLFVFFRNRCRRFIHRIVWRNPERIEYAHRSSASRY